MTAAPDTKGLFARPEVARREADLSATSPHGLAAVPPQPSESALPPAFRRALAGGAPKRAVPPPPKPCREVSGAAMRGPGAPGQAAPPNASVGPRRGHK